MDQVELPSQLYLKYDGVEYRGGRGEVIVAKYSSSIHPHPTPVQGGRPGGVPVHSRGRGAAPPGGALPGEQERVGSPADLPQPQQELPLCWLRGETSINIDLFFLYDPFLRWS